jgi:hypothetical protein
MMAMPSIMHIAFADSIARTFMIRFTGTVGITIRMFMIPITRGIHHHGQCRGTGVGDVVGTHLIIAGVGDIHPITATGTDHTMADGDIPITVPGMDTVVIMEDITEAIITAVGMLIQKTIVTAEGHPALLMCGTETEPTETCLAHQHAHHPQKVHEMQMNDVQLPTAHMPNVEVHQALV